MKKTELHTEIGNKDYTTLQDFFDDLTDYIDDNVPDSEWIVDLVYDFVRENGYDLNQYFEILDVDNSTRNCGWSFVLVNQTDHYSELLLLGPSKESDIILRSTIGVPNIIGTATYECTQEVEVRAGTAILQYNIARLISVSAIGTVFDSLGNKTSLPAFSANNNRLVSDTACFGVIKVVYEFVGYIVRVNY